MAVVLVNGQTGSGKTLSARNLPPAHTFIMDIGDKPFPFKGGAVNYSQLSTENPKGNKYSFSIPRDYKDFLVFKDKVFRIINAVNKDERFKYLVVDDVQYFSAFEMIRRGSEKSFSKFTDMAGGLVDLIQKLKECRKDLDIALLWHEEVKDTGIIGTKTVGKMVDQYLTIEGLFTYVVRAMRRPDLFDRDAGFCFITSQAESTCKLPPGMFQGDAIPSDLNILFKGIHAYENGQDYDYEADYKSSI